MSATQDPIYQPEDVKAWLTKVFGKRIIFETEMSKYIHRGMQDQTAPVMGAWRIEGPTVYLQIDLPPGMDAHFNERLRYGLQNVIDHSIDKDSWNKGLRGRAEMARRSDWPLANEVMWSGLRMDLEPLKILAERLKRPADIYNIPDQMQQHEKAWMERKVKLPRRCDIAFLGVDPTKENTTPLAFRYGRKLGSSEGLELSLVLLEYYTSPFPEHSDKNETRRPWEVHWRNRGNELGLDGAFHFRDFHEGTHAPTEQQKLVLYGATDHEIANRMDDLLDPKMLPKVQAYFHEVISSTLIRTWFPDNQHPDYGSDLKTEWAGLAANFKDAARTAERTSKRTQMLATPKYTQWAEEFPKLVEANPTTGKFIEAVFCVPPEGQEGLYGRLQRWAVDSFPVIATPLLEKFVQKQLDQAVHKAFRVRGGSKPRSTPS